MKITKLLMAACCALGISASPQTVYGQDRLPGYLQAEKFTQAKLRTMLFSTSVDPHWFQKGNSFWYTYKTSEGNFWYVYQKEFPFWNQCGSTEVEKSMVRSLACVNFSACR